MGYYVADNMNTESSVKALNMAIKQRKNKETPLIHHSDRGCNIVRMITKH
jgi:transposase InsO family protein